jgi:hypothetical protein
MLVVQHSKLSPVMGEVGHEQPIGDGRATSALPLTATKSLRRIM